MKHAEGPAPTEADALEFAASAKQVLSVPRERVPAASATRFVRRRRLRLRPAFAGGLASLVLMLSVSAGLAYAANDSLPGDSLYGLDLALEKLGIGNGGLKERLAEAAQLADEDRTLEGLELAADAVNTSASGDEGLEAAAAALQAAVEATSGERGKSEQVLTEVADMLRWMATADLRGRAFGQGVAEFAREIGADDGQTSDGPGLPPQATDGDPTSEDSGVTLPPQAGDVTLPPQATERTLPPQAVGH